jgi:hypothetical protein
MDEAPPLGLFVIAVLADGSELLAAWDGKQWTEGVADDPVDAVVDDVVVSWRWRDD